MKKLLFFLTALLCLQSSNGEEPARLESLRDSYERELERVTTPVTRKYLEALRTLQHNYTTGGDLNAALAVKKEIDSLTQNDPKPKLTGDEPSFSKWIRTVGLEKGNVILIVEEKTVVEKRDDGKSFSFTLDAVDEEQRVVTYVFGDGAKATIKISPNRKTGDFLYKSGNMERPSELTVVPRPTQ